MVSGLNSIVVTTTTPLLLILSLVVSIKVVINRGDHVTHDFMLVDFNQNGTDIFGDIDSSSVTSIWKHHVPNVRSPFRACYNATTLTNLIVLTTDTRQLTSALENITQEASTFTPRQSYCQIFLIVPTCNPNTFTNLTTESFIDPTITNPPRFPFDLYSDLYIASYCEYTDSKTTFRLNVTLWEMYSIKNNLFTHPIAYEQDGLLNLTTFQFGIGSKAVRRQNVHGVTVAAAAFLDPDNENDNMYEIKVMEIHNTTRFVSGLSVSIYQDFQSAMNFTEKAVKVYLNVENYFETSFTSDSYVFDINLYHLGITKNRTDVAQSLHPTYFDGVHAIFLQPSGQGVRNIYMKPFAFQMWSSLLLTWTTIFLCCKLFVYVQTKLWVEKEPHPLPIFVETTSSATRERDRANDYIIPNDPHPPHFEALLWCIATICQQGWYNIPKSTSLRLIILTGLCLSVVCYVAFTGKIVSELWDIAKPINSLKQLMSAVDHVYLLTSSDTSFDVLEGLSNRSPELIHKVRFNSIDKVYTELTGKPGKSCVITWSDFLASFVREKIGVTEDEDGVVSSASKGADAYICETFSSFSFQATSSLFVPKNSEFEGIFNYRIIIGLERGFIRRYWKQYLRYTKLSCVRTNPQMTTLDLGDVFFAFFVCFCGLAVSVALLIVESTWRQLHFRVLAH